MMVRFTREALSHIEAIHSYVSEKNARAAARITWRIFSDIERLEKFPKLGHVGVVPVTYEWVIRGLPYVVVYEIDARNDTLIVLGIFHGSRER